jgi:hypothetical protein
MKFNPKRGLFRLAIAAGVILVSVPVADSFLLGFIGILFCVLWLVCWVTGGFLDMD